MSSKNKTESSNSTDSDLFDELPFLTEGSHVPQAPFLPQDDPKGPEFLDTEACLCQLRPSPEANSTDDSPPLLWRCFGNQTNGHLYPDDGKWFKAKGDGHSKNQPKDWTDRPLFDSSSPPITDASFRWDYDEESLVGNARELSVWDKACTGKNRSSFSTSYYRSVEAMRKDETPIDAAPCWRPGAVPLPMQNVSDWQQNGCSEGFLCTPQKTWHGHPEVPS